jgi:hypothetical protein
MKLQALDLSEVFWFAYEKYLHHCLPNLRLLRIWQDNDNLPEERDVVRSCINTQSPWNNFCGPMVGNRCTTVCREAIRDPLL